MPNLRTILTTVKTWLYLADKFNEYYTSVDPTAADKASSLASEHNLDLNLNILQPEQMTNSRNEFQLKPVSGKDVQKVISGFSSNKAPGYDRISSRILKDGAPCILSTITQLMNNSFSSDSFANAWKIAEVLLS